MFKKIITILFVVAAFAATACEDEPIKNFHSDVGYVGVEKDKTPEESPEYVLITNRNFYNVTRIRVSNLTVDSVPAGPFPAKLYISADNRNVFVFADLDEGNAFAWLDIRAGIMKGYYDLGNARNAASYAENNKVTFSPDGSFAIVQSYPAATMFMFDLTTGTLHRYLQPNLIFQDVHIADNGQVFFINDGGGINLVRFDANTQAFETVYGTFLEIGWRGDKYYTFDADNDRLVIVDTTAGEIAYESMPGDAQTFAADDELNVIAVGSVGAGDAASSLTVYRPESGNSTRIELQVQPNGLMASPDGSWAVAYNSNSNIVEAIDLDDAASLGTIQVSVYTPDGTPILDDQAHDMTSERALLVDLKRELLVVVERGSLHATATTLEDLPSKIAFDPTGKVALFSAGVAGATIQSRLYRVLFDEDLGTEVISLPDEFDFFSFTNDGSKAVTRINGLDPEYDASISAPCKPMWTFGGYITAVTGDTDTLAVDGTITSECEPRHTEPQDKLQVVDLQNFTVDYIDFPREILYQNYNLEHDILMFVDKEVEEGDGILDADRTILRGGIVSLLYPEMGLMTGDGEKPQGFFIDPAGKLLYITMNETDDVTVFDLINLRTFSFKSGVGPQSVAFSPDSRYGFISHGHPLGTISFYDSISEKVFKRIVAPGAYGMFDEY